MKPEQQTKVRIAIAEWMGWRQLSDYPITLRDTEEEAWADYCWRHPVHGVGHGDYEPPDYCNDLNACHEAEKGLTPNQQWKYIGELLTILDIEWTDWHAQVMVAVHATAMQRAEALYRTIKGEAP